MLRGKKMISIIIAAVVLLSITGFVLFVKFYTPLNRYLFGGEIEIASGDIKFWAEKEPERNYYHVRAKYLKCSEGLGRKGHTIFFADTKRTLGFNNIFFDPKNNKIYGGGLRKKEDGNGHFII